MVAIQVMQKIMKDARMREDADQVQTEVMHMMEDVARLHERVSKLGQHFGQVSEDVRQVLISAEKVERRAAKIESLDFSESDVASPALPLAPRLPAGE